MATRGTVKRVVAERGFGFIRPDDGGADVFFHVREVDPKLHLETMAEMDVVFDTKQTDKGPQAVGVRSAR